MKLIIKNFRHYQSNTPTVFDFKEGALTRIVGESGSGKSTIFLAISWVIHGGLRGMALRPVGHPKLHNHSADVDTEVAVSEISKFGASESATVVILICDGFKIKRRAAATSAVEVEINNGGDSRPLTLTSKAAEKWIWDRFMSKGLWTASSYLAQKSSNPLITSTNAEKFSILFEIAFACEETEGTSPEVILSKIAENLTASRKEAVIATASSAAAKDSLDARISSIKEMNGDMSAPSGKSISEIKSDIDTLEDEEEILIQTLRSTERIRVQTDELLHSIGKERARLSKIDIDSLGVNTIPTDEEISKFSNLATTLATMSGAVVNRYTQDDLDSAKFLSELYKKISWFSGSSGVIINIAESFNCEEPNLILFDRLFEAMAHSAKIINGIQDKINALPIDKTNDSYESIIEELSVRKRSTKRKYICGGCGEVVDSSTAKVISSKCGNYTDSELFKMVELLEQYSAFEKDLNREKTFLNSVKAEFGKFGVTEDEFSAVDLDDYFVSSDNSPKDYFKIYQIIKAFIITAEVTPSVDITITVVEELKSNSSPIDVLSKIKESIKDIKCEDLVRSEFTSRFMDGVDVNKLLKDPVSGSRKISEMALQMQKTSSNINNKLNDFNESRLRISDLEKELENKEIDILGCNDDTITSLKENIKSIRIKTSELYKELTVMAANAGITEELKRVETLTKAEMLAHQKAGALSEVLKYSNGVATDILSETIKTISSLANLILSELFEKDSPVQIDLSVIEKKSTAATISAGNSVSLTVTHRGAVYEGIPLISGGEFDRLSCAITIALASISNTPFVIFDEVMSSVTPLQKERCLDTIRKYLPGKTVLEVSHIEVPSAFYDEHLILGR